MSTQPPVRWVTGLLHGIEWQERGADPKPPPSAGIKEIVQLYLFSLSGLHGLFQGELHLSRRDLTPKFLIYGSQNLQILISLSIIYSLVFLMDVNSIV